MVINEIEGTKQYLPLEQQKNPGIIQSGGSKETSFADTLKEFVSDVNNLQKESNELKEKFIKGEPVDIHDVMIASEKAKTGFNLLLQMRSRFVDFYREINRMQV